MAQCSAIVWSDALKRTRQCQNSAGPGGVCSRHAKHPPRGTPVPVGKSKVLLTVPAETSTNRTGATVASVAATTAVKDPELELARRVISAARKFLRDPAMKGRFVAVLGDYEEKYGID